MCNMKRNEQFVIKRIGESIYLLPVGQMIAEQNFGIRINETCEYIWEQMSQEISFDELMKRCAAKFNPEGDETEVLRNDIQNLIGLLKDRGMIDGSRSIFRCGCAMCRNGSPVSEPKYGLGTFFGKKGNPESHYGSFVIGGLPVEMYGDKEYFYESFEEFRVKNDSRDFTEIGMDNIISDLQPMDVIVVNSKEYANTKIRYARTLEEGFYDEHNDNTQDAMVSSNSTDDTQKAVIQDDFPKVNISDSASEIFKRDDFNIGRNSRKVVIHHNDLTVLEYDEEYVLFFYELPGVEELHMSKDGSKAVFFCEEPSEEIRFNLFHAIRMAFLVYALEHGKVMLHSCSILFKDKVWAFSGPSGTGKSTHCEIWNRLFATPYVNGDLNLIGIEDGMPYVYGTPWCGSSETFDVKRYPLGGIILLKQYPENFIEELSDEKKILYVQQRLITSIWDKEMLDATFDIINEVVKKICVVRYHCNKKDEAGYIIQDRILKSLSS